MAEGNAEVTIHDILQYEVHSSRLYRHISIPWMQRWASRYLAANKVKRKYARYQKSLQRRKMAADFADGWEPGDVTEALALLKRWSNDSSDDTGWEELKKRLEDGSLKTRI